MDDELKTYRSKRNFARTPEPAGDGAREAQASSFVIQKHWASRLHYDFRLELDGTMKSWAVPKGPSYDSHDKRMAVQVEDHPISYSSFEGTIPEGEYGAGKVIIWDKGVWTAQGDARQGYADGNLKFELRGHKMHGKWVLVRMKGRGEKQQPWLLIKEKDEYARPAAEFSVVDEMPDSVARLATPRARQARGMPPEAVKAALPATLAPQLATLVDKAPSTPQDWIFEVKFDGYRLLARISGRQVQLFTRNGHDWTERLDVLRKALLAAKLPSGWYDGEIVMHDARGRPDFGLLQQAFENGGSTDMVYFLFDLPYFKGYDMRAVPLEARRAVLEAALTPSDTIRFSAQFDGAPKELVAAACQLGLEGMIGKRRNAPYVSRRSSDWIKLKCGQRQEFVIGGYTDPQGTRGGIGSLLLGIYDEQGQLRYAGNVGTGFDQATLKELKRRLEALETESSPFAQGAVAGRKAHWVKPRLIAEVSFAQWTRGGSIRHAVFQGPREDKPLKDIQREKAQPLDESVAVGATLPGDFKVTHGERVVDAQSGATKMDVVRYYALVARLMMEHLKGRPLALVRAPAGVGGELFFQKHADVGKLPGVKQMSRALDPEHPQMLEIDSMHGVLSAAQWNVLEFHTQNALGSSYGTPDRMVFDLDPGEGVAWKSMLEAAQLLHAFLDELGLPGYLKTSGGKGLHIVVPVKPALDWDTVKRFSQAIVQHMATTLPDRFAAKSGPRNRVGRIYIDYLRNGQGATTACAWSARVRPGLGISVPLAWDELGSLKSADQWNVRNVHTRLDKGNAPWAAYKRSARSLAPPMKRLGFKA
ncbi:MAG: DNA ligase D [Pseudomonadota bacterium]